MSEPEIGSKVDDKFILLELIGSGASGSVYKARHIFLDEEIAIKFVSTDLFESPESAERFKREAAVLSSMSHSNIVKFHSFGFADGRYYMALELLKGQTLAAMIAQDGALSEANALDIFLDICAGLAYVHEKGIVHRDVKPGNVMISSNEAGRCCKLLDFGILKNFAEDQKLTKTGLFVGSSNYMSPEQCKGIALDGRSDIYSLGCLIYETLVGKAPMDDESDLLIMSNQTLKNISSVPAKHGISREMETLILRCLNKNPDSRFASASALKQALESARARPLQRQAQRNLLAKLVKPAACLAIVLAVLAGIQLARKGVEPQLTQKLLKHPTAFEYSRNDSPDPSPNLPRSLQQLSDWLSNEKNKGADKIIIIRAQIYQGQVRNRLGLAQIPADFMDEFTLQKQSGMFLRLKQFGACLKFKHHFAPLHLLSAKSAFEGEKAAEKDIESLESVNNETSDPFESKTIINNVKESKASACLRLSEIESWRGDLANAEKHARRAYEVLAPESSSKSDALLRLALVQYMKGELAQCRKTILKEMDFESSALKSGSSVSLGDESLALMNEIGLAPSVSKFMLEFFPDPYPELRANHQNKILRMQLELARSLLLQKKYQDCFETLDALLDYCNSTMSAEETGDRAEGLYLRALHLCKRDSEIGVHLRRYFEQLKRSTVETRQLEALPLLIRDLTKIGFSLNLLSELIEADLHKQEEKETVPTICIDARLAQGETALFRKDFTNALRYFQQAEKNCQARDTQQCRYLRALALARQMETKIAVREYDKVLDLHALFLKLNEKGSGKNEMAEPLFFYGRHLNLKAKYLLNAALSDSNTQVKRLNKMVTEHRKQGISILDDYAACARDCAQIEVKENRQAEALTTLSAAIDNLENYQGWKQTERAALLELMCRILNQSLTNLESTKPALNLETKRAEIKNELEKCKLRLAKLEIPDRTQSLINDGPLKTLPWLCPASI